LKSYLKRLIITLIRIPKLPVNIHLIENLYLLDGNYLALVE
jgi:hypothetical protein